MIQEQIIKINSMCENNWRLDVQYYLYHDEKTLIKQIDLDNTHYLEFRLSYNSKNQVVLHISKFYHGEGETFASTSRNGKDHNNRRYPN